MPATLCLPSRSNLEHLKGQARTLQHQSAPATNIARHGARVPPGRKQPRRARRPPGRRPAGPRPPVRLSELGGAAPPSGRGGAVCPLSHEDGQALGAGSPADDLVRLGCLLYGGADPLRHADAGPSRNSHPNWPALPSAPQMPSARSPCPALHRRRPRCANRTGSLGAAPLPRLLPDRHVRETGPLQTPSSLDQRLEDGLIPPLRQPQFRRHDAAPSCR